MKPSVRIQHELDMDCRRMPIFVIPQLFLMVYRWRRRGRLQCGVSHFAINETHYRRCSHIEVMQGKLAKSTLKETRFDEGGDGERR
jgi:hypothetical protein